MAAGRGEFLSSVLGWSRKLELTARKPGPGDHQEGRKRPPKAALSSVRETSHRGPKPRINDSICSSKGNLIERLPPEILLKILSYLDASSLICISHVSKLFHRLSNDEVLWWQIYTSDFGSHAWRPKTAAGDAALEVRLVEDGSAGHWKKMYFRSVAGQDMSVWRRQMRDVSPYTGLPRQTEWVLSNLKVSWELAVCACNGREITVERNHAYFFESSVILHWSGRHFPKYHQIAGIQLYGVRKDRLKSLEARKPGWRSLILKLNMKTERGFVIGRDSLVTLRQLQPCLIIGTWRGTDSVAFIMVTLHFHRLVERSLLGSPVCPYSEPDLHPRDHLDPERGLQGYSLHFVLHNTGSEIMSGHFRQLCCTVPIQHELMELRAIDRNNLSQHRSLSGNIRLPWKSEALEGSVENCCIMTLTLLDEYQKPFWCVSSSISIMRSKRRLSFDYDGKHFRMRFQNPEGRVTMKLVWLTEQKQFFIISLTIYIPVYRINKHFSREY